MGLPPVAKSIKKKAKYGNGTIKMQMGGPIVGAALSVWPQDGGFARHSMSPLASSPGHIGTEEVPRKLKKQRAVEQGMHHLTPS